MEAFGLMGTAVIYIFGFVITVLAVLMPLYIYQMNYRIKRMEKLFQQYCKNMDNHFRFANQHLRSLASVEIENRLNSIHHRSME